MFYKSLSRKNAAIDSYADHINSHFDEFLGIFQIIFIRFIFFYFLFFSFPLFIRFSDLMRITGKPRVIWNADYSLRDRFELIMGFDVSQVRHSVSFSSFFFFLSFFFVPLPLLIFLPIRQEHQEPPHLVVERLKSSQKKIKKDDLLTLQANTCSSTSSQYLDSFVSVGGVVALCEYIDYLLSQLNQVKILQNDLYLFM